MTIQGNVTYTRTGQTLAKAGRDSYANKTWDTAREIMKDTFQSIASSELTSPGEKAIADLGLRVGSHNMPNTDAASARYAVSQTIAGAVGGPIGAVLAQATLDAYSGKQYTSARAITKDGLTAITRYSAEGNDLAVARLGIKFGDNVVTNEDAAEARKAALKTIARGAHGDRGQVLAETTLNVYGNKSYEAARMMTKDGLEAIAQDSECSDDQKALAKLGLAFGDHHMTHDDAAEARQTVLKKLANPITSSLTDALSEVSLEAYGNKQYVAARAILKDGFEAVLKNPNATAEEKELARLGIEIGNGHMTNEAAATARRSIMQQLKDL
jgi:hypothetical protein